jgi:DNA-binding MarR family transcriptional regulator
MAVSAQDVQQALKERILRSVYPRGGTLPPVRALATELGASPSTVGRAVQELHRQGWVSVANRRGAVVRRRLPSGEAGGRDVEAALRRLALRWRLGGERRGALEALVGRVLDEVFQPEPRTLFLECNPIDLRLMAAQVQRETTVEVEPLLIEEARAQRARLDAAVLLTPYFHLAEVRELAPERAEVVPLNFVASQETMRALLDLEPDTRVGVVAVNDRSRRRLEAIVRQYSPLVVVRGVLLEDARGVRRLLAASDVVVATHAAGLSEELLARIGRLVLVGFALEADGLRLATLARPAGEGARAAPARPG